MFLRGLDVESVVESSLNFKVFIYVIVNFDVGKGILFILFL